MLNLRKSIIRSAPLLSLVSAACLYCSGTTAAAAGTDRTPSADSIAVFCDKNRIPTAVRVSGLETGDIVNVYDSETGGKVIGQSLFRDGDSFGSLDVDLDALNEQVPDLYVSVARNGEPEGMRREVPVLADFAPVLQDFHIAVVKSADKLAAKLSLKLTADEGAAKVSMVFQTETKTGKSKETFVTLKKNGDSGLYEGTALFGTNDRSFWHASQIMLVSQSGERFIYTDSNAAETWICYNQEHIELDGLDIRLK